MNSCSLRLLGAAVITTEQVILGRILLAMDLSTQPEMAN